jgi:hypothetical protein
MLVNYCGGLGQWAGATHDAAMRCLWIFYFRKLHGKPT